MISGSTQGQLVSVQRASCKSDVYDLAVRNEWLSLFVARKLKGQSPNDTHAGTYLESQGVLDFGQLRSLFFSEVVHRVEALCDVQNAEFMFRAIANLPIHEMTGLSISATKITKQGMRGVGLSSGKNRYSLKVLKSQLSRSENQIPSCTSHLASSER